MSIQSPGYHLTNIPRGIYGHESKIFEEVEEFRDAIAQENKILQLVELSDLLGAVEGFLETNFPSVSIDDVLKMSKVTKRAFQNGHG